MRRHFLLIVFLLAAAASAFSGQDVLFLYDGPARRSEAFKTASYIDKLLSHFSLGPGNLVPARDYAAGQSDSAAFVFVVFEEGTPDIPEVLLRDLARRKAPIVWINLHIEKFLERDPEHWGLTHIGLDFSGNFRVTYKGKTFVKEDPEFNMIRVDAPERVTVASRLIDGSGREWPYILRSRNLWYAADAPYSFAHEGGRFLVLADLLHDVFGLDHPPSRRAMLRIEDLTPEDDPAEMLRVANFLAGEKVPFQISLVPRFRDPKSQVEIDLADRPEFVEAVRAMTAKGGTVVLHGVTHQHRGLSADDFEFWDDVSGEPLAFDSPAWVRQRISQGLRECFRQGIYPLAWETPHYSASRNTYRVIAEYFDTFNDRLMAADMSGAQVLSPYPFRDAELGVEVIPENLGYVDLANPDPDRLLRNAENMTVVRDGLASCFFHSFVPLRHLKRLVRGMKAQGWEFVSLRDFGCNLRTESCWVTSSGGAGSVTAVNQYVRESTWNRRGRLAGRELSTSRRTGPVLRRIEPPPGGLYVLETLDLIPERTQSFGPPWLSTLQRRVLEARPENGEPELRLARAVLVTSPSPTKPEDFNSRSHQSVLRYFGAIPKSLRASAVRPDVLQEFNLVIVPRAAAVRLKSEGVNALLEFVERGGALVTEGRSELSESLGFRDMGRTVRVEEVREHSLPGRELRWNPPVEAPVFAAEDAVLLAAEASGGIPLACLKTVGRGRVLFLAVPLDDLGPFGINRFAYYPHYLRNSLAVPFQVRRGRVEYYFDPGQRPFAGWEKLVKQWKASGVKTIYLAAWHFYRDWSFNYRYFLRLCHAHGLAVYAWFEYPQVTPLMWEEHPEWREKTATGRDGLCHWRLQMNLFNPDAREAARVFMRRILMEHDWDGVNLAEINFDTNKGAADPSKFVPMNADVREAFRREAGFDPREFFDPASPRFHRAAPRAWESFLRFRTRITAAWHSYFLEEIESVRKAKGRDMEIIVTAMDSLLHPEIVEECGLDTKDVIALMDRHDFTLQVEDPARSWTEAPDRYVALAAAYLERVPDPARLMFDINIVPRRGFESVSLPTDSAVGAELAATVFYAGLATGRVAVYSEFTVPPLDMDILPFVMGSDVEVKREGRGYRLEAGKPFQLFWNGRDSRPRLDGRPWPFATETTLSVPSGIHRLDFVPKKILGFQGLEHRVLLDADIENIDVEGNTIRLAYESPLAASLSFNRPLERIELDGRELQADDGDLSLLLPRGRHRLTLILSHPVLHRLDEVGYASSSAFSLIGLAAALVLTGLYLHVRWTR